MQSDKAVPTAAMPTPAAAVAFFNPGLLNEQEIRRWLFRQFHDTAACPRCRHEPLNAAAASFWQGGRVCCKGCGCWYQATTGTPLAGLKLSMTQIFLVLAGIGLNLDNRTIAGIVGTTQGTVRDFRKRTEVSSCEH